MKFFLSAAAALALTSPVAAQTMTNQPSEILSVARGFGAAALQQSSGGQPLLNGTIEGTNYGILMYGCDGPRACESIQFFATFTTSNRALEHLNAWNEDQRFGAAYVNDSGRVFLHWSANLDFGVTVANLTDSFDIWRLTMAEFQAHVTPN